jgi:glutamine amidotransferase
MKIGIINYGMGNLSSVKNSLHFLHFDAEIVEDPKDFVQYDKLILPGVGAFAQAMENIRDKNILENLTIEVLEKKKPLLGLCLGMQLLFDESSENGINNGFGFIEGKVISIKDKTTNIAVPHMGWNNLNIQRTHEFFNEIPEIENDVYFVHSYFCEAKNREDVLATCDYGVVMDVIIQKENIFGCQFHPEKSHKIGLKLIQNFCEL